MKAGLIAAAAGLIGVGAFYSGENNNEVTEVQASAQNQVQSISQDLRLQERFAQFQSQPCQDKLATISDLQVLIGQPVMATVQELKKNCIDLPVEPEQV